MTDRPLMEEDELEEVGHRASSSQALGVGRLVRLWRWGYS